MNLPPSFRGLPTRPGFVVEARRFVAGDSMHFRRFPTPEGWQAELLGTPLGPPFKVDTAAEARSMASAWVREWLLEFDQVWRAPS